jgi:tRNA-splicing ligase RtcB (3'-phosphate/5'-hydroxy nucleic acid ligase)
MISTLDTGANPVYLWTDVNAVEYEALNQLRNIANLPWIYKHVAVMPDVHFGKGATVGSVIAMKDALSPSAVGVDIGCGMAAIRTSLKAEDLPEDLSVLRLAIESQIPVGFSANEKAKKAVPGIDGLFNSFTDLHDGVQDRFDNAARQMGTLGGGNHFIELCIDLDGDVWMMLHSGSRNIGKELAERHIKIAKTLDHNAKIPDPDLAVFLNGTPEMKAYRHDLTWAQKYAYMNRQTMLATYRDILRNYFPGVTFGKEVNCHHNYVNEENHYGEDVLVTRKGAISAREGELGIIPGSMGAKSFIVSGKGNRESFNSASHGAGRRMSRSQAKREFSVEDLVKQTAGVECRKDQGVVDEIPAAYKNIEEVMAYQSDLVSIVAELRQVLCVKG